MNALSKVSPIRSKPKLLVLASTFPRWPEDTEPRFVEYLSYELAEKFDVVVIAPHCRGAARDEVLNYGDRSIIVHRFRYFIPAFQSLAYDGGILAKLQRNPLRLIQAPFFLLGQLFSVLKLVRRESVDVIHAHWIIPQGLVAAALTAVSRNSPPVLVTSHGGDLFALRGKLLMGIKRWVLKYATRVSVVSEAMRAEVVGLGCEESKVTVRSMGVDLQRTFTPPGNEDGRSGIVFVGRLVEKKGVRYLIEAMGSLAERFPGLDLTIIGDGPLRDELQQLVARLHLDTNIRFAGSVPNTDLPAKLRKASVAVMPSVVAGSGDQEGLGLVAVEAMGCGCAVVASDLPAVRDVIEDGQSGLLAAPGDTEDLARKIARLIEDKDLRRSLGRNGRQFALRHFDWRKVGQRYADLLNEMLPR